MKCRIETTIFRDHAKKESANKHGLVPIIFVHESFQWNVELHRGADQSPISNMEKASDL